MTDNKTNIILDGVYDKQVRYDFYYCSKTYVRHLESRLNIVRPFPADSQNLYFF